VLALVATSGRATAAIIRAADVLCPLMLAAFLPMLFDHRTWAGQPVVFLFQLAILVLLA
jgi:hypothetical protein